MSPRTGRPKIENPKSDRIGVRLDQETIQKLDEVVKIENSSRSAVIREGIEKVYAEHEK